MVTLSSVRPSLNFGFASVSLATGSGRTTSSGNLCLGWSGRGCSGCGHSGSPSLWEGGRRGCTDAPSHSGCIDHLNGCIVRLGGSIEGGKNGSGGMERIEWGTKLKWCSIEGDIEMVHIEGGYLPGYTNQYNYLVTGMSPFYT